MKKICTFLSLTLMLSVVSCDEGGKRAQKDAESKKEKTDKKEGDAVGSVDILLPGSVHIGEVFKKAGLKYVKGITNDPDNASNYNTKTDKLLNYGVYSADLTYSALNGQSQKASTYLKVLRDMGEQIGFSEILGDEDLLNRFEDNLDDQDSIVNLLVEIQKRTDSFMDDNDIKKESIVIFTGGWIEGMYLGVQASELSEQDEINRRLIEQMAILDNLLDVLEPMSSRISNLKPVVQDLEDLNTTYLNAAGNNGNDDNIGLADLKKIADKVVALRNSIV